MKTLNIFLTLILVFNFSTVDAKSEPNLSLFNLSLKYYAQENYVESYKTLIKLIKIEPQNSLYWFNLGNNLFMLKKYSSALKAFENVIKLNKNFVAMGHLYKIKTLIKLGELSEAQSYAENLLADQNYSEVQKKLIRNEIDEIQTIYDLETEALALYQENKYKESLDVLVRLSERSFSQNAKMILAFNWLSLGQKSKAQRILVLIYKNNKTTAETKNDILGILRQENNQNKNLKATQLIVNTSIGQTSNLYVDGDSLPHENSEVFKLNTSINHNLNNSIFKNYELNYQFNFESFIKDKTLQTQSHDFKFGKNESSSGLPLQIFLGIQFNYWNQNWAYHKTYMSFNYNQINDNSEFGLNFDYGQQSSMSSEFNYLRGHVTDINIFYGHWDGLYYFQIYSPFHFENTSDIVYNDGSRLPLNHLSYGLGLKYNRRFTEKWSSGLTIQGLFKSYKNPSIPLSTNRIDKELSLNIKLLYQHSNSLSPYISLELLDNKSTLGQNDVRDKNYQVNQYHLGLSWRF